MRALHAIGTFLLLIGVGFFLFDLMYHFAVNSKTSFLSVQEVWTDFSKSSFEEAKGRAGMFIPTEKLNLIVHLPAPVALLAIAAVFYIPFRILALFGLGRNDDMKK